jgi:hypothetical protein
LLGTSTLAQAQTGSTPATPPGPQTEHQKANQAEPQKSTQAEPEKANKAEPQKSTQAEPQKPSKAEPQKSTQAEPQKAQPNQPTTTRSSEAKPNQPGATKSSEAKPDQPGATRSGDRPNATNSGSSTEPGKVPNGAGENRPSSASMGPVNLTASQKTEIHNTIISDHSAPRASNLGISLAVGVAVPETVRFAPLPPRIVEIEPAWRGYEYFVYADEIVIIEPGTRRVVAILVS